MAKVKVHAGDFLEGDNNFSFGSFSLKTLEHSFLGETISIKELKTIKIVTEENIKTLGGTAGWATAGAVALGPVGLLAGALLGGKKKEVTFIATFRDGRKMLASTDSHTFKVFQAEVF